jgi:hypothetical protein
MTTNMIDTPWRMPLISADRLPDSHTHSLPVYRHSHTNAEMIQHNNLVVPTLHPTAPHMIQRLNVQRVVGLAIMLQLASTLAKR